MRPPTSHHFLQALHLRRLLGCLWSDSVGGGRGQEPSGCGRESPPTPHATSRPPRTAHMLSHSMGHPPLIVCMKGIQRGSRRDQFLSLIYTYRTSVRFLTAASPTKGLVPWLPLSRGWKSQTPRCSNVCIPRPPQIGNSTQLDVSCLCISFFTGMSAEPEFECP